MEGQGAINETGRGRERHELEKVGGLRYPLHTQVEMSGRLDIGYHLGIRAEVSTGNRNLGSEAYGLSLELVPGLTRAGG